MMNTQKPKEEPVNSEPVSTESEVSNLKKKIGELEAQRHQDRELSRINTELIQASQKNEFTKTNPKMAKSISLEVLTRVNANPRLSIGATFNEVAKERVAAIQEAIEAEKKKAEANNKVRSSMNPALRSEGTQPLFQAPREFKGSDLKSGAIRKALQEMLSEYGSE